MKHAIIYERKGILYIRTSSETTEGVWIDEGPCLAVSISSSAEEIGLAVRSVLSSSRTNIAHPTSWAVVNDKLFHAAGVKSWNTFGKNAKCIKIELDKQIRMLPTKNMGNKGGFMVIEEKITNISHNATSKEIGDKIKALFGFWE
jgi:hypothetical protein